MKLLQLIELVSDSNIVKERSLLSDLQFSFPFEKLGNLIQLELRSDVLISSSRPLEPITNESTDGLELPNIHPIKETITLNTENIYNLRNLYRTYWNKNLFILLTLSILLQLLRSTC